MALINCPECGREISDQAQSCPHCGVPIALTAQPVDQDADSTQKVEVTSIKINNARKIKKIIAMAVVVVLAVAGCAFWYQQYKAQEEAEAAAKARLEYIDNLNSVTFLMLDGAAKSETLCNLTKQVWYNTIYEESDVDTDQYTKSGGKFYSDFNTSLYMLYAADSTIDDVTYIQNNQDAVKELMKLLSNPTEEFDACYDILNDLYDVYYNFTSLAISPSGSLQTYSEEFSEYDTDFMTYYNRIELLIPDE